MSGAARVGTTLARLSSDRTTVTLYTVLVERSRMLHPLGAPRTRRGVGPMGAADVTGVRTAADER